jgi:hypothetical protein
MTPAASTGIFYRVTSDNGSGSPSLFKEDWNAGSLERGTVQRRLEQFVGRIVPSIMVIMGKRDSKLRNLSHVVMGLKIILISP